MASTRYCPKCGERVATVDEQMENEQIRTQPKLEQDIRANRVKLVPACARCGWFQGLDEVLERVSREGEG